jgi:peroxiredoxin
MDSQSHPSWMNYVLKAAAIYNVLFGLMTLVVPFWIFDITGATRPNYPELWQCNGMIVGVYGIGYWIASYNPLRHWPIVLVGFLGKVLGPLGFAKAVFEGVFPVAFGWIIVFNDLVWWVPFYLILAAAISRAAQPDLQNVKQKDRDIFDSWIEQSHSSPVLVVFLRHAGCTFCREMLSDLKERAAAIEQRDIQTYLVHMGASSGSRFESQFRLEGLPESWKLVSDPGRALYQLAGLKRGRLGQLFSPSSLWRGFVAGILNRKGVGALEGDGFMMPGAFMWSNGERVFEWKPQTAGQRIQLPF